MKLVVKDDDGTEITLPAPGEVQAFLKAHRKKARMSLQDVAEQVGVSRQTVWLWENGKTTPSVESLVALVQLLGPDAKQPVPTIGVASEPPKLPKPAQTEEAKADMTANLKLAEEILGA